MLKRFFYIGLANQIDDYTRNKIILSNQVSFALILIDIFYSILSYFNCPQILFMYIGGLIGIGVILLCMHLGSHLTARMLNSVLPLAIGGYNYLVLSKSTQNDMINSAMIVFSLAIVPFILFDAREKVYRNTSFLICALLILNYPHFKEMIDVTVSPKGETGRSILSYVNIAMAVSILFLFLSILQSSSKRAEDRNKKLVAEMEQQNEKVYEKTQILEQTLQEVERRRLEEEKRAWVVNGIAQISVILRQEDNLHELYDQLIRAIVKYTEANQGGLYLVQGENEKYLELGAMYAYDKKKFIEQRIEIGQGLVGQCYLEKEKTILSEVPTSYIRITSGLGEATPRFICVVPLMVQDDVEGVLELASFAAFEDYKIEFLDKLGDAVAATLKNLKMNQQTREMLEISKQQAEEMRAQEEEMRQNMEEMEATQEHQLRLQEELQEKLEMMQGQEHLVQMVMTQLNDAKKELEILKSSKLT